MIGCHFRAFYGTYKPRSGVGLGKGSHSPFQRLVEPLAHTCAKSKRTYGLCTRQSRVCQAVVAGVNLYAPACAQAYRARQRARIATLAPPPLTVAVGAHSQFFPTFSLGTFPHFFNDNDVKDFYDN